MMPSVVIEEIEGRILPPPPPPPPPPPSPPVAAAEAEAVRKTLRELARDRRRHARLEAS